MGDLKGTKFGSMQRSYEIYAPHSRMLKEGGLPKVRASCGMNLFRIDRRPELEPETPWNPFGKNVVKYTIGILMCYDVSKLLR